MFDTYIFCGGKSGSTTLTKTFINHGYKAIQIHSEDYYNKFIKKKYKLPLYTLIDLSKKNKRIAVIDVYRLPIERKISSFFQNIHTIPNYKTKSIQQLIDIFNSDHLYRIENYHSINEIMDHYHVPHFDSFDFKNRFVMKYSNNILFIKLHFNDIHQWNYILSKITNKPIVISPENISNQKEYNTIYKQFKEQYTLPTNYLSIIENDKEFKIYNTPQEQLDYLSKWNKKIYI